MSRIWGHFNKWLQENAIILITLTTLFLLRSLGLRPSQMGINVEAILAVISLLASHALGQSKNKILISVSCVVIGFLAIIGPVAALAILGGSAFLLEDAKKTFFYFVLMALLIIEEHFALNGFITGNKNINLAYQCIQLVAIFVLIRVRGMQAPAIFALVLLALSGVAKMNMDSLLLSALLVLMFVGSLMWQNFTLSVLALGMTWAVSSSSLGLTLIAAALIVVNMIIEKFDKKEAALELIPLVMVVSFASYSIWIAALAMVIFVLRIAFNNRIQVCLMKSRL